MTPDFLITALIVVLAPGTGVLYTLAVSPARGWRTGVAAAFGCTLGILPHIAAAVLGVAALLHASATAFAIVKYAGVAYLLYIAWMTLQNDGPLSFEEKRDTRSLWAIIASGGLINILNPKLSVFFLAFLPQFITPGAGAIGQMLLLGGVFMLVTFVVFVIYAAFAAQTRAYVVSRPTVLAWIRRSVAGAFLFFGARLALAER